MNEEENDSSPAIKVSIASFARFVVGGSHVTVGQLIIEDDQVLFVNEVHEHLPGPKVLRISQQL